MLARATGDDGGEDQRILCFYVYLFPLFLPPELLASSELVVIFPRVSTPFDTPLTGLPTPRLIPLVPLSAKLRFDPILLLRIVRNLLVVGLVLPFISSLSIVDIARTCVTVIGDEPSEESSYSTCILALFFAFGVGNGMSEFPFLRLTIASALFVGGSLAAFAYVPTV
jgi:hypothetical protein